MIVVIILKRYGIGQKMKRTVFICILLLSLVNAAFGKDEEQRRERLHSVKEVIGQVTKMQDKNVSMVENFKHMFEDGKVSGQFRTMYAGYEQQQAGASDSYATAVGGILKYELAAFNGFNAGVAFYTSQDILPASGNDTKHNPELSSDKGNYADVHEAYINYTYKSLNLRAGRQRLETPLADSDDIRMVPNSFEAYVASYDYKGFKGMLGYINSWQGVDANLSGGWSKTGSDGVNFAGVQYSKVYELNLWLYNITGYTNALYFDTGINYDITSSLLFHGMLQYLQEDELSLSGYDAVIYGAMAEFVVKGLGVNFAYNAADTTGHKQTFAGTGGGRLFTSLDTTTLDVVALDRKAQAFVSGMSYNYNNFNFLYAYGAFVGSKDSNNKKAYIVEQDIGLEYNVNEEFIVSAIYVLSDDRQSSIKTENDWKRAQLMMHYNF